jgi:hypothetical protein
MPLLLVPLRLSPRLMLVFRIRVELADDMTAHRTALSDRRYAAAASGMFDTFSDTELALSVDLCEERH